MTTTEISSVDAWEAFDSRGRPTVACRVDLSDGASGVATVPSGASTGRHEARELRDGGVRHQGLGVQVAVGHVRTELADAMIGRQPDDLSRLDKALRDVDGTPDLSRLGANAVLAVSLATAIALANSRREPLWRLMGAEPQLPLPMVNIISGGAHAGGVIDIQDVLAIPVGASTFSEAIEWASRVRQATAEVAFSEGIASHLVADEGGVAAHLPNNRAAIELIARGIEASGLRLGDDIGIAVDVAATQLLNPDGHYRLASENRVLEAGELVDEIGEWCGSFPIVSVEDPLAEDDWNGWEYATRRLGDIQLLGDDLFVTHLERLRVGHAKGVANAILIKPNQNGTLTGALRVLAEARTLNYATVVSARSGETEDNWLADVAVGSRSGQIKVGSTTRSDRTAKWNRLLQIEREAHAGTMAFAGRHVLGGRATRA